MQKIFIVALILMIAGAAVSVSVMFLADWNFENLNTGKHETVTHTTLEDFTGIYIDGITDDVEILKSDDEFCRAVFLERECMKHTISVNNGILTIEKKDDSKWYQKILDFKSDKITLYLPNSVYSSLKIDVTTGDVKLSEGFTFGELDVKVTTGDIVSLSSAEDSASFKSTTGDVTLRDMKAKTLSVSLTTGDLTGSRIDCNGEFKIETRSGGVLLENIDCGKLKVDKTTGDTELVRVIAEEKMSIECTTGDVRLERCDSSEVYIKTTTGDVIGSFITDKDVHAHTTTGDIEVPKIPEGGKCDINTTTGDIKIEIAE